MIITTHEFDPNHDIPNHLPSSESRLFGDSDLIGSPGLAADLFGKFFEEWLGEQNRDLEALSLAVKAKPEFTRHQAEWTRSVDQLVGRVIGHYENYYRVKSESVKRDVVHMLNPSWRSHLEDTFLWVGGWRPTMAFHLLYSIFESQLGESTRGLGTSVFAGLSPTQLSQIDKLHRRTIKKEKALSETMAAHQETVADSTMVELSHLATELTRGPNPTTRPESTLHHAPLTQAELTQDPDSGTSPESVENRVDSTLAQKEDMMAEILEEADKLRLRTLKQVVEILSPIQAAHFLIAASELHLRVHEWGTNRDAHAHVDAGIGPPPISP